MRSYSTLDYLRDNFLPLDRFLNFSEKHNTKSKTKSFFRKVFNIDYDYHIVRMVGNLPYALLIIYLGFLAIFTLLKYTERGDGLRIVTITTGSMAPVIQPGSVVVSTSPGILKIGDIVNYKELNFLSHTETGRVITHRIIDRKANGYLTKGDSNRYPDPVLVEPKYILGKVTYIIPYLGYFDLLIKTIPGFLVLVVLPALILIKNEVKYIRTVRE